MAGALPKATTPPAGWALRAAERSPSVQRSLTRSVQRAQQIVEAAQRLVATRGSDFTTQDLVREAGVAIQTFYKYFVGKDQVLLAVIETMVADACADLRERGRALPDPVAKLRLYITGVLQVSGPGGMSTPGARFITTEHWRLQQLYPDQLAAATRPFTELVLEALQAAAAQGLLKPADPEYDAWLASQLIMAVFHHYAFAATGAVSDVSVDHIAERLWSFCGGAFAGASDVSAV